jgi:hypothetical protein
VGLADATPDDLAQAGLSDVGVPDLSALASVEAKDVPGGTARRRVLEQLDAIDQRVAGW